VHVDHEKGSVRGFVKTYDQTIVPINDFKFRCEQIENSEEKLCEAKGTVNGVAYTEFSVLTDAVGEAIWNEECRKHFVAPPCDCPPFTREDFDKLTNDKDESAF
jgi:hypothetical protein